MEVVGAYSPIAPRSERKVPRQMIVLEAFATFVIRLLPRTAYGLDQDSYHSGEGFVLWRGSVS